MNRESEASAMAMPNGPGAAAVLAAGIGCFAVSALAFAGDKSRPFAALLNWYRPSGPLSGVTTTAIVFWLLSWDILRYLWRRRDVDLIRVSVAAGVLLLLSILLTFPPIVDLL